MELKPINVAYTGGIDGLLIVPYGIETKARNTAQELNTLLIVPYGIETIYVL